MALSIVNLSTGADLTTNPAINYPANIISGRLIIAGIHIDNGTGTVTTPDGWTLINSMVGTNGTPGAGTGPRTIFIYYKIAVGDESGTQTFNSSGHSGSTGLMWQFAASVGASFDIASCKGEDTAGGASWSAAMDVDPGFTKGDLLVYFLGTPTTASNMLGSWGTEVVAPAGCTTTFTGSTFEWEYGTGNDGGFRGRASTVDSGTSTDVITHTASAVPATNTNIYGPEIIIRIRERVADAPWAGVGTPVKGPGLASIFAVPAPWLGTDWQLPVQVAETNALAEEIAVTATANNATVMVAMNAVEQVSTQATVDNPGPSVAVSAGIP